MAMTLSDVARQSGVSVGTVSRVLNNKMVSPIPRETITRIRQAAEELNYRPNPLARALATGRTHTIGLFSSELTDPHFAQMLEAVERKARSLGFHLIVSSSLEGVSNQGRVDGTIVLGKPHRFSTDAMLNGQPAIFVYNAEVAQSELVAWSDEEGMFLATNHLLELGHRHIAALFCTGDETAEMAQAKARGFRRAMTIAGATAYECWNAFYPNPLRQSEQYANGYRNVRKLVDDAVPFTAIVARNDFIAQGALSALREVGMRVPDQVSIVGYTDSIQAVCADPPLTSVRTPIAAAGEIAVEHLVRRFDESEYCFPGVLLPTSLSVRQSTAGFAGSKA